MAITKISEMPAASALAGTELTEIVQSGVNKKLTLNEIKQFTGNVATITCVFDGGGSVIQTGAQSEIIVPYGFTINNIYLLADISGSIVIDIWADTFANYPPTNSDSITASAPPTLASSISSNDSTLTGWTTTIAANTILKFNVDSCTSIRRATLIIQGVKT